MANGSRIEIINPTAYSRGYRTLITERCLKCGVVICDDDDSRYHADISSNNMTPCQEELLYESMP